MSYKRGLSIVIGGVVAALVSAAATWPRFHPAGPDNNPPVGGAGAVATAASSTASATEAATSAVTPTPSSFGETSAFVDSLVPPLTSDDPLSWSHLNDAQRTALAPFAAQWDKFGDTRKRKWLRIAARYQKMSSDAQKRLHDRMTEWVRMTPDQRSVARENFQVSRALPPQARQKAWKAYQQLPADQKAKLAASERRRRPTIISAPPVGKARNHNIDHTNFTGGSQPHGGQHGPAPAAPPATVPMLPPASSSVTSELYRGGS